MERIVTVEQEAGLHARPASAFVEAAGEFESEITVGRANGDGAVDAGSMLAVTGLGIERGDAVRLTAEGPDADDALDQLVALLERPEP
ncbi:HPr family phosphocarrier protein [Salinarchaeum laminariae]|uniref:HPr family phosphocarrier protein n=1 Tax=Salinarchaeum laminariae TaxID=869888 RepID=UPI0020BE0F13|nr:HPr family phosphocarrier protein [Salinarchaeum laminariae]